MGTAPRKKPARAASPTRATAAKKAPPKRAGSAPRKSTSSKPTLLAGGNPQIPKGDGDGLVQAYIAAMPGWKRESGRRQDGLIEQLVARWIRRASELPGWIP